MPRDESQYETGGGPCLAAAAGGIPGHRSGRHQHRVLGEGGERRSGHSRPDASRSAHPEVVELDLQIEEGQVVAYRARLKISFKYEDQRS